MNARVLIVDDDAGVVSTLTSILEAGGYQVTAASSFEEGKRLLLEPPAPAVLITDVRLGMFNGLQLALLSPPSTAVLVISGYLDRTLEAETQRLGGVYMLKPVPAALLLDTIRSLVSPV